jgi:hypothetical protein
VVLLPVLLQGLAPALWANDTSSGPEDADLFKGESVDFYFYRNHFFTFDMTIPGDWHPLASKEFFWFIRNVGTRN